MTGLIVITIIGVYFSRQWFLFEMKNWKKLWGGGRNVDDQNVDRPKISERRNGLFSWSERRIQNVENVFWVDQNYDDQNVENRLST
jgi:hypothetical protein